MAAGLKLDFFRHDLPARRKVESSLWMCQCTMQDTNSHTPADNCSYPMHKV